MSMHPDKFTRFRVAGVSFIPSYPGNLKQLWKMGADGESPSAEPFPVVLIPNPDNEYDANAVEVHVPALGDDGMVGHIPAELAAKVAQAMRDGIKVGANVVWVAIDPHHPDRPGIECRVWVVREAVAA